MDETMDQVYVDAGLPVVVFDPEPMIGPHVDFNQAVVNLEKAAAMGSAHAFTLLGQLWATHSVFFNEELHYYAYESYKEEGIPLGVPEIEGVPDGDPSLKVAFNKLSRAVELDPDEVWAMNSLSGFFRLGLVVEKDEGKAFELIKFAYTRGLAMVKEGNYKIRCSAWGEFTRRSAMSALSTMCITYTFMLSKGMGCQLDLDSARRIMKEFFDGLDCSIGRKPAFSLRFAADRLGVAH